MTRKTTQVQGRDLQSLDGFADQERDRAHILEIEFDEDDIEEKRP